MKIDINRKYIPLKYRNCECRKHLKGLTHSFKLHGADLSQDWTVFHSTIYIKKTEKGLYKGYVMFHGPFYDTSKIIPLGLSLREAKNRALKLGFHKSTWNAESELIHKNE